MRNPLVSIIVPVYNVANYIRKCAHSLFSQTYTNCEFVFVDDCGTDNSIAILKDVASQYKSLNIKILKHGFNRGLAAARNTGIMNATGAYFLHVDSDDWISHDAVEKLLKKAESTQSDVVLFDCKFVYNDRTEDFKNLRWTISKKDSLRRWILSPLTSNCIYFAKASIYKDNNIRLIDGVNICEAFYLSILVLYFAKSVVNLEESLYFYNRCNLSSYTNNLHKYRGQELKAYDGIINFFNALGELRFYERELAWRVLKCKQDLVLDYNTFDEFNEILPFSNKYIMSCPYEWCNTKIKVLMWLASHHFYGALNILLNLRNIKHNR